MSDDPLDPPETKPPRQRVRRWKPGDPLIVMPISHIIVAFLIIVGGFYFVEQRDRSALEKEQTTAALSLYNNQLASCDRGNEFRTEINVMGDALVTFMLDAADNRDKLAKVSTGSAKVQNAKAAQNYRDLAKTVPTFKQVDCLKKIPPPPGITAYVVPPQGRPVLTTLLAMLVSPNGR